VYLLFVVVSLVVSAPPSIVVSSETLYSAHLLTLFQFVLHSVNLHFTVYRVWQINFKITWLLSFASKRRRGRAMHVMSTERQRSIDMICHSHDVIRPFARPVGDATNCHYDARQLVYWCLILLAGRSWSGDS